MDWSGRVGEISELFRTEWIVGYHWKVPKIFSMPDRVGPVYYSPTFRFLNATWYFGIYRHRSTRGEDWIGLEIRRPVDHPLMPALFSIGVMHANEMEYLIHRNQNYPSKDSLCSINEFLPASILQNCRDRFAPSSTLTVTCVIWPDVPPPNEFKKFWYSELNMNSEDKEYENEKETEDEQDQATENERNTATKSTPVGNDGIFRDISRGVEWKVGLPPAMTTWDLLSSEFTFGDMKYRFNLYPGGIDSENVYLRFIVNISSDASFPLRIRWQMAIKRGDSAELRWIMQGQMTLFQEYHQHVQQICIKRAELEASLSSGARLTFVHHLNLGEVDTSKEVSTQTEFEEPFKFWLQQPEEEIRLQTSLVRCIQQETFERKNGEILPELPRRDEKYLMFAA